MRHFSLTFPLTSSRFPGENVLRSPGKKRPDSRCWFWSQYNILGSWGYLGDERLPKIFFSLKGALKNEYLQFPSFMDYKK